MNMKNNFQRVYKMDCGGLAMHRSSHNMYLYFLIFGCAGSPLLPGLFSSYNEQGLLFVVGCGLLFVGAPLVGEHRLKARGLQ